MCSFEPVKWMRYVPASPGGIDIRSTCGPRNSRTADLWPPRPITSSTTPRLVNRSIRAAGSSVSASRSRSPIVSLRRRNEPAGSIERRPGAPSRPATIGVDQLLGLRQQEPPRRPALERLDPGEDLLLGLLREALEAAERARLGRLAEVLERLDVELLVDEADGLRPEAGDREQLDEARRDLRAEPLVVGHVAGRDELRDLVADRLADARDLRRVAGPVGRDEVDRAAADRVGGAVVGDRLERDLALDLEHVADLVEDPREVAVRQVAGGAPGRPLRRRPSSSWGRDRRRRSGLSAAECASVSSGIVGRW